MQTVEYWAIWRKDTKTLADKEGYPCSDSNVDPPLLSGCETRIDKAIKWLDTVSMRVKYRKVKVQVEVIE